MFKSFCRLVLYKRKIEVKTGHCKVDKLKFDYKIEKEVKSKIVKWLIYKTNVSRYSLKFLLGEDNEY